MGFNPLQEKGIPIEKQLRNWGELNSQPYNKDTVHPYTKTRIILMNGIEVEAEIFSHQFARHIDDDALKGALALTRRIEQQQQKAVNWLMPGNETTLEATIGYEQVAVDLTANLAKTEPDQYVKEIFNFGLLEDFDHLYRYSNLYELIEGKKAEKLVKNLTEITPGRPTAVEHRYPLDDLRRHIDKNKADYLTQLHILTLVAGEQQTMNFYMNMGNRYTEEIARGLYLEIAQIEEQHVTQYESLLDPNVTWLEMLVLHEYNECYLYYSFMNQETDERVKRLWEQHLHMEIEHLKMAIELTKKYENRDITQMLPKEMPQLVIFESNIDYVRQILRTQIDFNACRKEILPSSEIPRDSEYFMYQKIVNGNGFIPSEKVIEDNIEEHGGDYRLEVKGPHPVERMRTRERVAR